MKIPTITDTRGVKSQTLFFVTLALIAILFRFVAGMFTTMGLVDVTSFAMAFSTILAPWVAREGIEKLVTNPNGFLRNPSDRSESEGVFQIPPGA